VSARWVKLDVAYFGHPKLLGLHDKGKLLHVASILWTAEHLTDGYVPERALSELSARVELHPSKRRAMARNLVERGLWDEVPPPRGGWIVHDFAEHNLASTREYVERERELTRQRVARHRALRAVE
jgi:hypothetical protein